MRSDVHLEGREETSHELPLELCKVLPFSIASHFFISPYVLVLYSSVVLSLLASYVFPCTKSPVSS